MFYVIAVRNWPVLVWLAAQPPPRFEVLRATSDLLSAVACFHDALALARERLPPPYGAVGGENTMSPWPPDAKNSPTYESVR